LIIAVQFLRRHFVSELKQVKNLGILLDMENTRTKEPMTTQNERDQEMCNAMSRKTVKVIAFIGATLGIEADDVSELDAAWRRQDYSEEKKRWIVVVQWSNSNGQFDLFVDLYPLTDDDLPVTYSIIGYCSVHQIPWRCRGLLDGVSPDFRE
jgi:hypothetical protein